MADSLQTSSRILMRLRQLVTLAALAATAACDGVLSTEPFDRLPADGAITDQATAEAALNGVYASLQSGSMYGLDVHMVGDLAGDNGRWVGTYQFLGDIVSNRLTADNPEVTAMWAGHYSLINRANVVLRDVPALDAVAAAQKDPILGQAHFLRALAYHNLVKYWGAVPTPTTPVQRPDDAAEYTRTPVLQVYDLILQDLDAAASMIPASATDTRRATRAAAQALRARVLFYRAGVAGNTGAAADYQAAFDAAHAVIAGRTLTVPYANLFTATGASTAEDIFRVPFTAAESNSLGNYWLWAGRYEAEPTASLNAAYEAGDQRKASTLGPRTAGSTRLQGLKYPTVAGTSHPHVIRLAELVLIKAEVLARQGQLPAAVGQYNQVRTRAGLTPHVFGVDVTTEAEVLAAITKERRLELALEGDRWPDLVRLGQAVAVKDIADRAYQVLFPIPLRDIKTSPKLEQNLGYD